MGHHKQSIIISTVTISVVTADSSSRRRPEDRTGSEAKSKGGKPEEGSAPLMTRMQLNDHKAGMQGLDKEHINQIIYEVSKGEFFPLFLSPTAGLISLMQQSKRWDKTHCFYDRF